MKGNFRDLNAAVARMATLSSGGRIAVEIVDEEINRLKTSWRSDRKRDASMKLTRVLNEKQISTLDLFDVCNWNRW